MSKIDLSELSKTVEWQREYMGQWVPTAEEATKRQVEQMTKRGVCPSCGKPCETTTVRDIQLSACPCVPKDRFYLVDASKWPQYVDGPQLHAQADDAIAWATSCAWRSRRCGDPAATSGAGLGAKRSGAVGRVRSGVRPRE